VFINRFLSDELKTRTLTPHQELEKVLITRMRAMVSINDYIRLLQHFYSYFSSVEDHLNLYIGSTELPDYPQRRKSASLARDITTLGGVLSEKTHATMLPEIKNHLQAFGALYVIEGSTLGGLIITQMIRKQLGLNQKGLSFFQSYGEHSTTMWDTFKLTLNQQADTIADADTIIAAAAATFRQFKVLLELNN
jgi:heme oxygenase